jgi:uncharacterized SAM-binding protein YcdF (DUF218 family)
MKTAIGIVVAAIIVIIGLAAYLGPDDLAQCGKVPSGRKECQPADAIVAVSGGDTNARMQEAIRLYKSGWALKLIFSGAARDKSGPSNAEAMRREARELGVPDEDIVTEEYGETTKQNAELTQAILERSNVKSVIIVTSAYHQRRASLEFVARSAETVTIRNHPVATDSQWSQWWWLTPGGWYLAISEFVKVVAFYLGGTR